MSNKPARIVDFVETDRGFDITIDEDGNFCVSVEDEERILHWGSNLESAYRYIDRQVGLEEDE